ncbi:12890_t:CDS:2 [Dentiscutata erythropus]|uniref:12890_t:CDS:1 n=1 Tax=Dentiscutata erythropus TaxID=1348616 RepID=A0A9N9NM21_9GLOM|nr:12890_t:CDS:2 [Dentiscutata erythropus]
MYQQFIKELSNQVKFHPHILKFFCVSRGCYNIFLSNSKLVNYFEEMTLYDKLCFAWEIASGASETILVHRKRIKVADFGLARKLDDSTNNIICGRAAYFDPYSYNYGKPGRPRNEKSDIYSLGVLF